MSDPIFVIHGVKNHDKQEYLKGHFAGLQKALPDQRLVPVFWGDLGGNREHVELAVPDLDDHGQRDLWRPDTGPTPLEVALLGPPSEDRRTANGPADPIPTIATAAGAGEVPEAVWQEALAAIWGELPYLSSIEDRALLDAIGAALAGDAPPTGQLPPGVHALAGGFWDGVLDWAKQRVRDVEHGLSVGIGAAAGRLNQMIRTKVLPDVAEFAGDVIVYQAHQAPIQDRVREVVTAEGYGTADKPARFVCHSLGGVITLDLCTKADDPMHVSGLVTFGSQWPLFDLVDPRGVVDRYVDTPVSLPPTLTGKWLNLWEPLDPLAFVASKLFRLADQTEPDDRRVPYRTSSGLWTHSAYWAHPALPEAVRDAFAL